MHTASPQTDSPRDAAPAGEQPCCPLCSGMLIPLRGFYRCSRCCFTLCAGCDTPQAAGADVCE